MRVYDNGVLVATIADPIPQEVTLAQARVALRAAGLFPQADAAVKAAGGPLADFWEYGNTISRGSPGMAALGKALGLSDKQLDDLFIAAGAITV